MHVAFFSDQHPASLGGLQVSLGLQRRYLEALGHMVTVCSPTGRVRSSPQYSRPTDVVLRAPRWGDHSFQTAGLLADREMEVGFSKLPPVDVVHIQADVWGAWNGYRYAWRHSLPVVHTMHTKIEDTLPAVVKMPKTVARLMFAAQQQYMHTRVPDMAAYVRAFANAADELIVPSGHFAEHLRGYGINRPMHVIPTGVDDRVIGGTVRMEEAGLLEQRERPLLVWPGRISAEKRLLDVLRALAESGIDADLDVYGAGPELARCRALAGRLGIGERVRFHGAVPHDVVMYAIAQADAVVQSSLGYETQGLTVYEAVSVGTPIVVRDPDIAADLPAEWVLPVQDASIAAFAEAFRELPGLLAPGGRFTQLGAAPTTFRQSALTDRILGVYADALLAGAGRGTAARRSRGMRAATMARIRKLRGGIANVA